MQSFQTGTRYDPENLQLCGKRIKTYSQKVLQKFSKEPFCTLSLYPSWIGLKVNWQILFLKKKYGLHCFNDFSVEVIICNVTVIILENMFGNIKSAVFIYGGIEEGEYAVELACLQMLHISLRKIFIHFLYLKLVSALFYQIFIFYQIIKCFLFHLKSSFRSQDIHIFVVFSLPFHTFQIQKNKWKWNDLWCHELACINLQV